MTFKTKIYQREQALKYTIILIGLIALFLTIFTIKSVNDYKTVKKDYKTLCTQYDTLYSEYEECACFLTEEEAIGDAVITPMVLNEENLYTWCVLIQAQFPEVIIAQAKIESGLGKSNLGRNYNNLFGMKYSKNDPLAIGKTESGYAVYANWQHSVISRIRWDRKFNTTDNLDSYLNTLARIYATDTNYKSKLVKIIKNNEF